MFEIWPGDIFATKGKGITGWASRTLTKSPSGRHTDRYHFGIIGHPVFDKEGNFVDFETRESLGKGPSCARFFDEYMNSDIEIYRASNITRAEGLRAVLSTSLIGRKDYGYIDFLYLIADAVRLMCHWHFPPYTSQDLRYSANDKYLCTEEAAYAMRAIEKPIEPPGQLEIWDIPTVYLQAIEEGRLQFRRHFNNLLKIYNQYIQLTSEAKVFQQDLRG